MHEVNIVSSSASAVPAGGVVVLTCHSMSSLPSEITWVGPYGPVTSGNGVTLITDQVNSESSIAFHPLRVSHAGQYTCVSTVAEVNSIEEASILVSVQGSCETLLHSLLFAGGITVMFSLQFLSL